MAATAQGTVEEQDGQAEEFTVFVARRVEPGYEEAFELWAKNILAAPRNTPATSAPGCCAPPTRASPGTCCCTSGMGTRALRRWLFPGAKG
ncbi:hypothetical protein [Kitasatospora sp. NPDC085464]|uniref:hypothetical protein n=1 Tax=Kitasatospora sp. NPDC085464 TaxID=3364063 RepID=UPI0037C9DCD5